MFPEEGGDELVLPLLLLLLPLLAAWSLFEGAPLMESAGGGGGGGGRGDSSRSTKADFRPPN